MTPTHAGPDSLPRLAAPPGRAAATPAPTPAPVPAKSDPQVDATMEAIAAATARAVGMPPATKPASQPASARSVKSQVVSGLVMSLVAFLVIVATVVPVIVVREAVGPATLESKAPPSTSGQELPTFLAAPPAYGTAQITLDTGGPQPERVQMLSGADRTKMVLTWLPGSAEGEGLTVLVDPAGLYVSTPGDPTWKLLDRDEVPDLDLFTSFARVFTFDDFFPAAVREYASLTSQGSTQLDGRAVQEYVVTVNAGLLQHDDPDTYGQWVLTRGGPADVDAQEIVTLWVDATGIVWKAQATPLGDEVYTASIELLSFSIDPFVPMIPTEFTDLRGT